MNINNQILNSNNQTIINNQNNNQVPITKFQTINNNRNSNNQNRKQRQFDLEERTYKFAKNCRDYVKKLLRTISNIEYGQQLTRSLGSVASNYIEANESLSKKDFFMRIKICRKEAKESRLWLNLTEIKDENKKEKESLIKEATELIKIFNSIIENAK